MLFPGEDNEFIAVIFEASKPHRLGCMLLRFLVSCSSKGHLLWDAPIRVPE